MTLFRNLLMLVGVLAIIGVALFFWRGDQFVNSFFAKPAPAPAVVPTGKVYAELSSKQGTLIADTTANDPTALNMSISELTEGQNNGFPPRNIPYLVVIDTKKNDVRYWMLSKNVRKVGVRSYPSQLEIKSNTAANGMLQVEVWVRDASDMKLEFEIGAPGSAPKT